MYYVYIASDGTVIGHISDADLGDQDPGNLYIVVDELPEVLTSPQEGYICKYIDGEFILEKLPDPEPDPISVLEEENALLAIELVQTQLRLEQIEQEQAELLLLLVSEGVI